MSEKRKMLEAFVHFITGFVLLLKGFDKIEQHHLLPGIVITVLGAAVYTLVFFGKYFRLQHDSVKIICYLIESAALYITAYVFFVEGKKGLPFAFLFSATAFLITAVIHVRATGKKKINS